VFSLWGNSCKKRQTKMQVSETPNIGEKNGIKG
jgi:hypothetical protein